MFSNTWILIYSGPYSEVKAKEKICRTNGSRGCWETALRARPAWRWKWGSLYYKGKYSKSEYLGTFWVWILPAAEDGRVLFPSSISGRVLKNLLRGFSRSALLPRLCCLLRTEQQLWLHTVQPTSHLSLMLPDIRASLLKQHGGPLHAPLCIQKLLAGALSYCKDNYRL